VGLSTERATVSADWEIAAESTTRLYAIALNTCAQAETTAQRVGVCCNVRRRTDCRALDAQSWQEVESGGPLPDTHRSSKQMQGNLVAGRQQRVTEPGRGAAVRKA